MHTKTKKAAISKPKKIVTKKTVKKGTLAAMEVAFKIAKQHNLDFSYIK